MSDTQQRPGDEATALPVRAEGIRQDVLQELTETDLDPASMELLKNMLSKEFVLANLSKPEKNEVVWNLRLKKQMFYWLHPHTDSIVTGDLRAYINDDPTDTLSPLSESEKFQLESIFDALRTRVTRSEDMKQQEMFNTEITEHRARDDREQDTGGLIGWWKS